MAECPDVEFFPGRSEKGATQPLGSRDRVAATEPYAPSSRRTDTSPDDGVDQSAEWSVLQESLVTKLRVMFSGIRFHTEEALSGFLVEFAENHQLTMKPEKRFMTVIASPDKPQIVVSLCDGTRFGVDVSIGRDRKIMKTSLWQKAREQKKDFLGIRNLFAKNKPEIKGLWWPHFLGNKNK